MKIKVVLQVGYCTERQRYKILKRVISSPGLLSVDWVGGDQLAVSGNNIDIVTLISKMRSRIGVYVDILSFTVETEEATCAAEEEIDGGEEEATCAAEAETGGGEEEGDGDGVNNESTEKNEEVQQPKVVCYVPLPRHCYCGGYHQCAAQNEMCRIM